MKVAVVGCGSIGTRHLKILKAHGVETYAVDVDPWVRDYAHFSLDAISSETLADVPSVDAWMICTPAHLHFEATTHALNAGGAVFVEKPFTMSLGEARTLTRMAAKHQRQTMVACNMRFHREVAAVALRDYTNPSGWAHWHYSGNMGVWPGVAYAPALWECIHEVDLALATFGEATVAEARITDDKATLTLVHGEDTSLIQIDGRALVPSRGVTVGNGYGITTHFNWDMGIDAVDQMYRDEVEHFLDCVRNKATPPATFADGLVAVEVVNEAYRLARRAHA